MEKIEKDKPERIQKIKVSFSFFYIFSNVSPWTKLSICTWSQWTFFDKSIDKFIKMV